MRPKRLIPILPSFRNGHQLKHQVPHRSPLPLPKSMVAPQITPLPTNLKDAKDQILARALTDRHGVFWSLRPEYRSQAETLETSLGFGTAGVLLCLLELHLIEPDKSTEELLLKGADWLMAQLRKRGFQHGLYGGSSVFHRCRSGSHSEDP